MSKILQNLIDNFQFLPGIGEKTAQRLTYYIFSNKQNKAQQFTEALQEALNNIRHCSQCRNLSEAELCDICTCPSRDLNMICIVEHPSNVTQIEQTQSYKGLYFVLHGALSPIDGITPEDLELPKLKSLIQDKRIKELIIATSTKIEGEATAYFIADQFNEYAKVTRLAHGLPIGGALDFIDGQTLLRAFHARHQLESE